MIKSSSCPEFGAKTTKRALSKCHAAIIPLPASPIEQVEFFSAAHTTVLNAMTCDIAPSTAIDDVGTCLATPVEEASISCHDIPLSRWTTWTRRLRKKRFLFFF
jgi:hypothetical protein